MHDPVLLNQVLDVLKLKSGSRVIDCTINGGGHSLAILKNIMPDGKILGIEYDPQIYRNLLAKLDEDENKWVGSSLIVVNDSYVNIEQIALNHGFLKPEAILFDFGISSFHVDVAERGFTFQKDQPLDMRFSNKDRSITAEAILNESTEEELADILFFLGEERFARAIARAIVRVRSSEPIKTTFQLNKIIESSVPAWYRRGRINSATKTYQALRIAVNTELVAVEEGLARAFSILTTGGRIAAISFHSLEDRIIKNAFNTYVKSGAGILPFKKVITADKAELKRNPRSRSAKLRVIEKI